LKFLTDGSSQTNFFTFISLTTGGIVLFETGVIVFYPAFSVSSSNIAKYIGGVSNLVAIMDRESGGSNEKI